MKPEHETALAEAGLPADGPGRERLGWAGVESWFLLAGVGAERCRADAALAIRCALHLHANGSRPTAEEAEFIVIALTSARPMLAAVVPQYADMSSYFARKLDRLRGLFRLFAQPEREREARRIGMLDDLLDEAAFVADVLDASHRAACLDGRGRRLEAFTDDYLTEAEAGAAAQEAGL